MFVAIATIFHEERKTIVLFLQSILRNKHSFERALLTALVTMLMLDTAEKTEITLKGSVEIVSEFFFTAINSILYQRGE